MSDAVLRLLDASLNRAREGLRVVEDYARFACNDPRALSTCKLMRNGLAEIARTLGDSALLNARATERDVGRALTSQAESTRTDARDVARTNLKRVQEALRSIEEYLKSIALPDLARFAEAMRYQSYTLERDLLADSLGSSRRAKLHAANVMLIFSEAACATSPRDVLAGALRAGISAIQLREKHESDRRRIASLTRSLELIHKQGTELEASPLVLINDRCDLALALAADGVHLGQDDLLLEHARTLLGEDALIGTSTHHLEELQYAEAQHIADYCGAGAMFASRSKDVSSIGGVAWGAQATRASELPVFCIGGITLDTLDELTKAGITRIAVSSAICASADPEASARAFVERMG